MRGVITTTAALVLAVWAAPASAQGQTIPAPRKVEFDEAIQRALDHNPNMALATTAIARAGALVQQARAATLPTASAGLTNSTLDGSRGFDGNTFQSQNQFGIAANATVPLIAATRWAGVGQAKDQVDVATANVADARQQIAVAAANAYLQVISARRQVEVFERALESTRAHLDYSQKRLEGGAGSRLNQLRAAVSVTADEGRLELGKLALRTAQEALGVVLAADGPVDAGAEPTFDVPATIDEAAWMSQRPDLIAQRSVQKAAERVLNDSSKDWWPTANASFDPVYITPGSLFQPSASWRLSLNLTQSIFEGGQRRAAKALRSVSFDQTKLQLTDLEIRAKSEVRVAQDSLRSLERVLETARTASDQSNDVLRISTSAFEVGATTNIEVIDAQRAARDADTAVAQAEDAVRHAKLELLVALGRFPK
jgi:outer membrane protein TolC